MESIIGILLQKKEKKTLEYIAIVTLNINPKINRIFLQQLYIFRKIEQIVHSAHIPLLKT